MAIAARAIKLGAGRSWRISTLGTGCQMNCFTDFGFGAVAIIAMSASRGARGRGKVPILCSAETSGSTFLGGLYQTIFFSSGLISSS